MKKALLILILFLIYSCKSQNNKKFNDCDIVSTKDDREFETFYSNIDTTFYYKDGLASFDKVRSGILLYQILHNNEFGNFVIIDNQEQTCRIIKKGIDKKVTLSEDDKRFLKNILPSIKSSNYYLSCKNDNNNSITLFVIKNNNLIVSRYFSTSTQFLKSKDIIDENYYNVINLLEVAYKDSFK